MRGAWSLSWPGVRTVAVLELRQRVRSTRWVVALVVWFVVVGAITGLTWAAVHAIGDDATLDGTGAPDGGLTFLAGPPIFGVVVFFVLFLGLLVSPTLSSTAVNGDRNAGTLATLQVTLLTPAEIAVGKLLAAWAAALAFLAVSVPFLVVALAAGGVPVASVLVCLAVLALLLAVVCAIGLGFSALSARTSGSVVLTFLTVAALTVLSPIVFALTLPAVTEREEVRVWTFPSSFTGEGHLPECVWETQTLDQAHTERTWWLLAVNPFVVLADAAPEAREENSIVGDPLAAIRAGVRLARTGPADELDFCTGNFTSVTPDGVEVSPESPVEEPEPDRSVVWPYGLAANLAARRGRARGRGPAAHRSRSAGSPAGRGSPERSPASASGPPGGPRRPSGLEGVVLRLGRDVVLHVEAQVAEHELQDPQDARRALAPQRTGRRTATTTAPRAPGRPRSAAGPARAPRRSRRGRRTGSRRRSPGRAPGRRSRGSRRARRARWPARRAAGRRPGRRRRRARSARAGRRPAWRPGARRPRACRTTASSSSGMVASGVEPAATSVTVER